MELEQLRMFVSAAESGSFSAAGRELYTSHSTVSRAVSALEKEMGVTLISRSNRVLGLTGAGELLLGLGALLAAVGAGMIYLPAGLITGGVLAIAGGVLDILGGDEK